MEENLRQLLLKDLCARLPYGVIAKVEEPQGYERRRIVGYFYGYFSTSETDYTVDEIKQYLRPMSSMTEGEQKEFHSFSNLGYDPVGLIDWLNAHHFDFRNLIEKGLALEAPKDMYNLK